MNLPSGLARWTHRSPQREYLEQKTPRYWIRRRHMRRARLLLSRIFFEARNWVRSRRESASILSEISRIVATQLFTAIILISGLEVLEQILKTYVGAPVGWILSQDAGHALESYLLKVRVDPSIYTEILTTTIQVAGVFLGLYFAAVSVVASTVYARVQGDVRNLLVREKVGNFYIRTVALLGAAATVMLAAAALGYTWGWTDEFQYASLPRQRPLRKD